MCSPSCPSWSSDSSSRDIGKRAPDGSVSRGLTAVDVQNLPRDEWGPFEIEDPLHDVVDLTDSSERMKLSQTLVALRIEAGILDDAEGDCVDRGCRVRRTQSPASA